MTFNQVQEITDNVQNAILVGLDRGERGCLPIENAMDELEELAKAAGANVLAQVVQNKQNIEVTTYIGSGKVEEIKTLAENLEANVIIFNDELSGSQIRNLEARIGQRIIDRTALILDIFALRAQSGIAKMQVELAQLKYRLPRLTGMGTTLSRMGGGIGTRGPGEQKLELDRRRIHKRLSDLQNRLDEAQQKREVTKKKRQKSELPIVALVGYTNSGKSTIMNSFINNFGNDEQDKKVFEKDMLFATLDTYHRKIELDKHKAFILIDTVGFVSKLPHGLIEAFKATLDEVLEADLLLHVVDAANQHHDLQIEVTEKTLKQIGVEDAPHICIFNKIDLLDASINDERATLQTSMKTGDGFDKLVSLIDQHLFKSIKKVKMHIPFTEGNILNTVMNLGKVDSTAYTEEGTQIEIDLDQLYIDKYARYIVEN